MPYIVTTKTPSVQTHVEGETKTHGHRLDRRAVATLDEAREYVRDLIAKQRRDDTDLANWSVVRGLQPGWSGSPIGPLPDGTVIEVEPASWDDLVGPENWNAATEEWEVIATYNAAQENR